ncbi:aldolase/citrate lyase family protein [Pseudonocardia kujensis]|uniref:HpcH/HpaI aldolase family protein n=1 Tax=Pseudonocardia kujensis TaxID=1128675 RepID=UPI001E3ECE71|nr:aldolase/citrate lyase family protein [Pseudonocardia kujensis]MCE0764071.1 aldolase/citrate lyase family protein [Pseudonocardia kujensis]
MPTWMTRTNRLKEQTRAGAHNLVAWATIPWPPIMELYGECGVDGVIIDLEHTSHGLDVAERMITAGQLAGVTTLVRVTGIDHVEIGKALCAGAEGIVFPRITTADDATRAWRTLRCRPEGDRGWGGQHTRHALWQPPGAVEALTQDDESLRGAYTMDYVRKSIDEIVSIFMIEDNEGLSNVAEILQDGQPDLVLFGWGDFSVESRFDRDACYAAAQRRVYDACRRREIGMSIYPEHTERPFFPGCYKIAAMDSMVLSGGVRSAIARARRSLENAPGETGRKP